MAVMASMLASCAGSHTQNRTYSRRLNAAWNSCAMRRVSIRVEQYLFVSEHILHQGP